MKVHQLIVLSVCTALIAGASGESVNNSWTEKYLLSTSLPVVNSTSLPQSHTIWTETRTTAWPKTRTTAWSRFQNTSHWAQTVERTSTPGPRPTATVTVGVAGELRFSPSTLNASVGTIISFDFLALNHTLTQSELWDPCHYHGGFNSGFQQFNPGNKSGKFVIDFEVTVPNPQWFFCSQTVVKSHCHVGMVFSLNAGGAHKSFLRNALGALETTTQSPLSACQMPAFSLTGGDPSPTGAFGSQSSGAAIVTMPISPPISSKGSIDYARDQLALLLLAMLLL